jgi:hypothetical protein
MFIKGDPETRFSTSDFFLIKQLPLGPDTRVSLSEYSFEFIAIFDKLGCTAVSMAPLCKYDTSVTFGSQMREDLATFKGNIYRRNIHSQIALHYIISITFLHKIWGLTKDCFWSQRCQL